MGLTSRERHEREHLLQLQSNHDRWFSRDEWDRLQELNEKLKQGGK